MLLDLDKQRPCSLTWMLAPDTSSPYNLAQMEAESKMKH